MSIKESPLALSNISQKEMSFNSRSKAFSVA